VSHDHRGATALGPAIVVAIAAVFVVTAGALVVGVGGDDRDAGTGPTVAPQRGAPSPQPAAAAPRDAAPGAFVAVVVASPTGRVLPVETIVDHLEPGDVLRLRARGGEAHGAGTVAECRRGTQGPAGCANAFPVQFDGDGEAHFQYQLAGARGCGPAEGCVVAVVDRRGRTGMVGVVFGAPAPAPPSIAVAPSGPYQPGDEVRVLVSGALPGAAVRMSLCGERCGVVTSVTADASGRARARLRLTERCDDCGIVVLSGVRDVVVPISFTARPSPRYDASRLAAGLVAATLLVLAAAVIVRRTDWRPPSEAATPELDAAHV
jgi:hypothetical protein